MVTVENNVGRLIEVRQTRKVTTEELQSSFPKFQQILGRSAQKFVMATDWRGMRVLDDQTSEMLLSIMRDENTRIEKQALIISPSAILGLQVRRLFAQAGGDDRMVFESPSAAVRWLAPSLSAAELQSLQAFINANVAA